MKCLITGIEIIPSYVNKKTGETDSAFILHMIGKSSTVTGYKTRAPFIAKSSNLYNSVFVDYFRIINAEPENGKRLINCVCDCEFNGQYLQEIEILETLKESPIKW